MARSNLFYFVVCGCFITRLALAQTTLHDLNTQVKAPYIKSEDVDRIVLQLYKIPPSLTDSQQNHIMFETYRLAASAYAVNNHFKQGYLLFQDYLNLKEKVLAKEKAALIADKTNKNKDKEIQMSSAVKNLKDQISLLEANEQQLKKRSSDLLRNSLLLVIFLSGIFAIVFLRFSVTLKKFKEEILRYKSQLLNLEKPALIGRLKTPVIANNHKQLEITRQEVNALQKLLKQLEPVVVKEKMNDFKKAKESFVKAESELKVLAKE